MIIGSLYSLVIAKGKLVATARKDFLVESNMDPKKEKYLLLLDMNGTICYRHEEPVSGVRESLYLRRRYFYKRWGIREFIQGLHQTGRFTICVYTSMMKHNAVPGLESILSPGIANVVIKDVLDRSMNKLDPEGENVRHFHISNNCELK